MRQIVLDTETTGLEIAEHHRIIEIACVELIDRKLTNQTFHFYLNPERNIDNEALAIHGLTEDFLKTKPKFIDIAEDFLKFIDGAELIIHNAPFDIGFLDFELERVKLLKQSLKLRHKIMDTLLLARQLHAGQRNSLDALCKRYGIDNSHRELHGALLDAHLLTNVYLIMTGGQGDLLDGLEINMKVDKTYAIDATKRDFNLPIILPTPLEKQLHEQMLGQMRVQHQCLWPLSE